MIAQYTLNIGTNKNLYIFGDVEICTELPAAKYEKILLQLNKTNFSRETADLPEY